MCLSMRLCVWRTLPGKYEVITIPKSHSSSSASASIQGLNSNGLHLKTDLTCLCLKVFHRIYSNEVWKSQQWNGCWWCCNPARKVSLTWISLQYYSHNVKVWLLLDLTISSPGDSQPNQLQCHHGRKRLLAGPTSKAIIQVDPLVLQLAWNRSCSSALSVRAQACFLDGNISSRGTKWTSIRPSLLSLRLIRSFFQSKLILSWFIIILDDLLKLNEYRIWFTSLFKNSFRGLLRTWLIEV